MQKCTGDGWQLRLVQHVMASRVFSQCFSLVATHGQVGWVWFWPHRTGGTPEAPEVSGLPSVTGNPRWCLVTRSGLPAPGSTFLLSLGPEPGPGCFASVSAVCPLRFLMSPGEASPNNSPIPARELARWFRAAREPGPVLAVMVLSCDFGQVPSCFWASIFSSVKCKW